MRVLVTGDREWKDHLAIFRRLEVLPPDTILIHGGARGADTIADLVWKWFRRTPVVYRAKWTEYGKAAGPARNRQMLLEGLPDLVLAFHHDLSKSKGTKDMVEIARKAGVEVRVFTS